MNPHLQDDEIETLLRPEAAASLSGTMANHLQSCAECMARVDAQRRFKAQLHSLAATKPAKSRNPPALNCPLPEVWLELAAGIPSSSADTHLDHAATCPHCGPLLREAMSDLHGAITPEEEAQISVLASASPVWQTNLAARLVNSPVSSVIQPIPISDPVAETTRVSRWRSFVLPAWTSFGKPWWLVAMATTTAIAAVVIAVGIAHQRAEQHHYDAAIRMPDASSSQTPLSDAQLLAQAYNTQRLIPLRVPGGDPVPLAPFTRGTKGTANESAALLRLRAHALENLDKNSSSPYAHQYMGEVDLVEGDATAALNHLNTAQAGNSRLPNLQRDLAAGLFEDAEYNGNTASYAQAAELYTKVLDGHPDDPALLHYNRALCMERQHFTESALDELRAALRTEQSPAWRTQIQAEIDRLSAKSEIVPGDGYEAALDDATAKLLPLWSSSASARSAIEKTAALGTRHHDGWLGGWIAAPHTPDAAEADRRLAASIAAGATGHPEISLAEAANAIDLYHRADHRPGLVRARSAQLFALQRLERNQECVDRAVQLEADSALRTYAAIEVRTLLDRGICESRAGDYASGEARFVQAQALSTSDDLPAIGVVALLAQADVLHYMGLLSSAWRLGIAGVEKCRQIDCPPKRRYGLYYVLSSTAQDLGTMHVATDIIRGAETFSFGSATSADRAAATAMLATLAGRSGDFNESARDFDRAYALGQTDANPETNRPAPITLDNALWHVDQAEVLATQGDLHRALGLLDQVSPVIETTDYGPGRISLYRQLARVDLLLGDYDAALTNALRAVREAERSLRPLNTSTAREHWARENAALYASLVAIYLKRGENTAALQAWEHFRAAPFIRTAGQRNPRASGPAATLVIARVGETYIGWIADPQSLEALRTVDLGDRAHILQQATTFYRLCADRGSSLVDIRSLGQRLYAELFAPLGTGVPGPRQLSVDLDPSLAMLPLSAISTPDGNWLGDTARITLLPPWWSLRRASAPAPDSFTPAASTVVLSGFGRDASSEAQEIARLFPNSRSMSGISSTPAEVLRALASAQLIHFSGHASSGEDTTLLFSGPTPKSGFALTPDSFSSTHLVRCRLAVLAACNTSSVDPDQIERLPGLRNALLLAGARNVIATNWDVDDRSTRALMLDFYRRLAPGLVPSSCLQAAQSTVRSTPGWQHPFYWAAFEEFSN